jgi:hypothetical protein
MLLFLGKTQHIMFVARHNIIITHTTSTIVNIVITAATTNTAVAITTTATSSLFSIIYFLLSHAATG